jgi:TonB family protein
MRRFGAFAAWVLALLSSSLSAADTDLNVLQPITPWDLDYGEKQCTATRDFGSPAGPITFAIIPAPNGTSYELVAAYKRTASAFAEEFQGTVDFGSGPIKAWALKYGTKDRKLTLYKYRISAAEMARSGSAKAVALRMQGGPKVSFALDHMNELLGGLQNCVTTLKDYWNMDGERNGRIAVPSKGDVRTVFSSNDYPWEAYYRGQEGTAQYLLLVDEKGAVAACHVLTPSGVPVLDAMGCVVIEERAKFKPALDPAGKPVRSTFVTPPVSWRMAR